MTPNFSTIESCILILDDDSLLREIKLYIGFDCILYS